MIISLISKRPKLVLINLILISIVFYLNSCDYEFVQPKKIDFNDSVSFSSDIIPIFNTSCNSSGCHGPGHYKVDLTPQNAYVDIFAKQLITPQDPDNSILYTKLLGSGTHNGRSTVSQQAIIRKWIEQGANDN